MAVTTIRRSFGPTSSPRCNGPARGWALARWRGQAALALLGAGEAADAAAEVGLAHLPDVAHGRVAVAEVERVGRRDDPLGHAVAGADDNVKAREVELLDRQGEERQIPPVVPDDPRRHLQEAGADRVRFDGLADAALEVEEGVDRRFGDEAGELNAYGAFSDIAFNPQRSLACQARSAAARGW